jgi:MFS transporter, DHA1 family, inner membrane transport protein
VVNVLSLTHLRRLSDCITICANDVRFENARLRRRRRGSDVGAAVTRSAARVRIGAAGRIYLATLSAYLTADFIAPISGSVVGGVDAGALVVPFCAAFAVAFPLWGRAADRHPAGAILAVSLGTLAAAGVLLAFATSEDTIIVARALQGAAAAGVPPTAQALLASRAGNASTGRAVSGMMIMVALATLGGPALASAVNGALGWRGTSLLLGVAPALAAAFLCAPLPAVATTARGRLRATPALVAGWACSTLVLAAYWTLLTRSQSIVEGVGISSDMSLLLPVAGAVGIPLVVVAGRTADRLGPRAPMMRTLGAGAAGLAVAAVTDSKLVFLAGACAALALYWSYLPVVSVQIQRSAPADARASAAGILYSSMWLGAALGGLAAVAAPNWRVIVGAAAGSWALAGAVAWRGFLRAPSSA